VQTIKKNSENKGKGTPKEVQKTRIKKAPGQEKVPRKFEAAPKMNRKVEVAFTPPKMKKKAWQPKVNIPKLTPHYQRRPRWYGERRYRSQKPNLHHQKENKK